LEEGGKEIESHCELSFFCGDGNSVSEADLYTQSPVYYNSHPVVVLYYMKKY